MIIIISVRANIIFCGAKAISLSACVGGWGGGGWIGGGDSNVM